MTGPDSVHALTEIITSIGHVSICTGQTDDVDFNQKRCYSFISFQGAFSVLIWGMSGLVKGVPGDQGADEYYLDNRVEVNKNNEFVYSYVFASVFVSVFVSVFLLGKQG